VLQVIVHPGPIGIGQRAGAAYAICEPYERVKRSDLDAGRDRQIVQPPQRGRHLNRRALPARWQFPITGSGPKETTGVGEQPDPIFTPAWRHRNGTRGLDRLGSYVDDDHTDVVRAPTIVGERDEAISRFSRTGRCFHGLVD
jgi:hypothetical protein